MPNFPLIKCCLCEERKRSYFFPDGNPNICIRCGGRRRRKRKIKGKRKIRPGDYYHTRKRHSPLKKVLGVGRLRTGETTVKYTFISGVHEGEVRVISHAKFLRNNVPAIITALVS